MGNNNAVTTEAYIAALKAVKQYCASRFEKGCEGCPTCINNGGDIKIGGTVVAAKGDMCLFDMIKERPQRGWSPQTWDIDWMAAQAEGSGAGGLPTDALPDDWDVLCPATRSVG